MAHEFEVIYQPLILGAKCIQQSILSSTLVYTLNMYFPNTATQILMEKLWCRMMRRLRQQYRLFIIVSFIKCILLFGQHVLLDEWIEGGERVGLEFRDFS